MPTITAAGEVGDGSDVIYTSIQVSGKSYDFSHLMKIFSCDGEYVLTHDKDFVWTFWTSKFAGRTDWARIYDEMRGIIFVLNGLLRVLRRSRTQLVPHSALWHRANGAAGPIYPQPTGVNIVCENEHTLTYTTNKS